MVDDEVAFISAATSEFPHRICFKFLAGIAADYKSNGDLSSSAGQRQLQKFLKEQMVTNENKKKKQIENRSNT